MRKRPRQPPFNNAHQASSAAAVSDSSSSSLCCYPFFYLLFITWIALFTLNPSLSHSSGSYSWSVPWFSGVHADRNNGEQRVENNGSFPHTQENPVPSNEINLSKHTQLGVTLGPSSVQGLKCRAPLLKEVLSLSAFPVCDHGSYKKRSSGFRPGSNLSFKRSARRHASLHANESRNESQQFQDSSNEGPLNQEGKLNVHRDGVVNYSKRSLHCHLEEQGTHVHVNGDREHHTKQLISEHDVHDHAKDGGEHYNVINVDTEKQYKAHPPPPRDNSTDNETGSTVTTSAILNKTHPALTNLSKAHLRQEPGDGLYNYAADSKGAKILASNKEVKGASNILNKDKDKYFRTPCNVETKFVDMELSEETLVVQIVIANHEFYSSNVREFEVWGSLIYPAEEWLSLGKFEAENSRVPQSFALREPHWVRYLKLQMLSHFGSDFYCTLSMVEVYGVDAIESLLEEWIAEDAAGPGVQTLPSKEENSSFSNKGGSPTHLQNQPPEKDADSENDFDLMLSQKLDDTFTDKVGDVSEGKGRNMEKPQSSHHQTGRPALDAVMKLLMQKVRSLEHKEPLFSQHFKDLEEKYKESSRAHSKEQLTMTNKLEDAATKIANLNALLQSMESKWNQERLSLQKDIFDQVKAWNTDLIFLRNELSRTENKELVALAVSFCSIITIAGIQVLMLCVSVFKPGKQNEMLLLSCSRTLWAVPFLSCVLVVFALSL